MKTMSSRPAEVDAVPSTVVDLAAVVRDHHLSAAEVVSHVDEAIAESDRHEVTHCRHLLLAGPEDHPVRLIDPYLQK